MKCISIKQPWAWLIIQGHKDIENRDWYTSYRGPLLVHASKTLADAKAMRWIDNMHHGIRLPDHYDIGAIIGEVEITGCVTHSDSLWFIGPYGFELENPVVYPRPIRYRGQLGLFDVPEEAIKRFAR